jgi:hypothetical protein
VGEADLKMNDYIDLSSLLKAKPKGKEGRVKKKDPFKY